jgi:hypothetical protein
MVQKTLGIGSRWMILVVILIGISGLCNAQSQSSPGTTPPSTPPAVAPEAIAALEKMGGFLRSLKAFTVRSENSTDEILTDTGQKLQFGSVVHYHVRLPDRLRADVNSDRKQRQFFYDGKTLTLYGQRVQYYATVPAPPTIREMIEMAAQQYGLELPLADLFFWGTDEARLDDIQSAIYVGPSWIDGATCDQYAFRQESVDWQIWIERSDTPLPRKLVITTTTEEAQPQYIAVLTWDLNPQFNDDTFTFVPPTDAHQIALRKVATETPDKK